MSGIHINPENKGKFNATKARTGKTTEELTHSSNPLTRKRAIFAQNAAKWHHETGGDLNIPMYGQMFAAGGPMGNQVPMEQPGQLTEFDEGGSHEENPNGGIPQGVASNGAQNLVEQGETKLNSKNYIFSDSLKIDKSIADEFYLPKKYVGKTFAEVSKIMNRPNSRREFDEIEEKAKTKDLDMLMNAQELFKQNEYQKDMQMMMEKHGDFLSPGIQVPQNNTFDFGGVLPPQNSVEEQMMQNQKNIAIQNQEGAAAKHAKNGQTGQMIGTGIGTVVGSYFGSPQVGAVAGGMLGKVVGNQFTKGGGLNNKLGLADENTDNPYFDENGNYIEEKATDAGMFDFFSNPNENNDITLPKKSISSLTPKAEYIDTTDVVKGDMNGDGIVNQYDRTASFDPSMNKLPGTEIKQSGLNALGQYAPVIGNIGMGLFMKPQKLNASDYTNNAKLTNWRNNINPQLKAVDEGFALGAKSIRNSSAGGGNYLSNMQELATNKMKAEAEIEAGAENQYNDRQLQIDQINAARGDQNAQMRLHIADYNARAKAAKQQALMKGIEQVGQIADANQRDKVGLEYAKMIAPDFKDDVQYKPYIDYLSSMITKK